jgi:hypothetical protein
MRTEQLYVVHLTPACATSSQFGDVCRRHVDEVAEELLTRELGPYWSPRDKKRLVLRDCPARGLEDVMDYTLALDGAPLARFSVSALDYFHLRLKMRVTLLGEGVR